jgi:hypothetical protein
VFNGWDEGIAASYLWQSILEDKGYDVKLTFADVAPVYQGLARGDFDLVLDTWLPTTHADYMERYGDKVDDLGAWNDDARLTVAVNADAPIDSLDQLAGIRPVRRSHRRHRTGLGLMRITGDDVVPGYGLEGMELVESSTPAMLAELKKDGCRAEHRGDAVAAALGVQRVSGEGPRRPEGPAGGCREHPLGGRDVVREGPPRGARLDLELHDAHRHARLARERDVQRVQR